MKIKALLLLLLFIINGYTQNCVVNIQSGTDTVCPNASQLFTANAYSTNSNFSFTNSNIPNGWNTNMQNFTPLNCIQPHPTETDIFVLSNDYTLNENHLTTNTFFSSCSDAILTFDLHTGPQTADASTCDGADDLQEGVIIEYSLGVGVNYYLLGYIYPDGSISDTIPTTNAPMIPTGTSTPLNSSWVKYSFIAPNTINQNVKFRISTFKSSYINLDNYYICNFSLTGETPCPTPNNTIISWSNSAYNTDSIQPTIISDTSFQAFGLNTLGDTLCSSNIHYKYIYQLDTFNMTLIDSLFNFNCVNDTLAIQVNEISGGLAPYTLHYNNQIYTDTFVHIPFTNFGYLDTNEFIITGQDACNTQVSDTFEVINNYPIQSIYDIVNYMDTLLGNYGTVFLDSIPGANYQWLYCDNNYFPVPGANSLSSFTFPYPGQFALEVDLFGCIDTTICFDQSIANLSAPPSFDLSVSPNPFDNYISITTSKPKGYNLFLYNTLGELVAIKENVYSESESFNFSYIDQGIYLLQIVGKDGNWNKTYRLVKQ